MDFESWSRGNTVDQVCKCLPEYPWEAVLLCSRIVARVGSRVPLQGDHGHESSRGPFSIHGSVRQHKERPILAQFDPTRERFKFAGLNPLNPGSTPGASAARAAE